MRTGILSAVIILLFELPHTITIRGDYPQVAADVYGRAEILKQQIRDEIRENQAAFHKAEDMDKSPEMANDYGLLDNEPITPIMEHHKSKNSKHREVVTKKPSTTTKKKPEQFSLKPLRMMSKKNKQSFIRPRKPSEIFYRRELDGRLNHPIRGIQCLDLLGPYLMGETGNGTFKIVSINNRQVLRVLQLISEKTDTSTKDEIYSLLYQISTLNIRLFQWDERAMRLLFNTIISDRVHSFRTLKSGIKKLLSKWHMDFGDISNILHQTKIFRPPCIQTSDLSGSTKTSRATRYTRPYSYSGGGGAKKTCVPYHDQDQHCL